MTARLKPGSKAPRAGVYELVLPVAGGTGVERALARGERLPAAPAKGARYVLRAPLPRARSAGLGLPEGVTRIAALAARAVGEDPEEFAARAVFERSQQILDQAFEARRARGAEMTDAEIEARFDRLGTEPPRPDDRMPDSD